MQEPFTPSDCKKLIKAIIEFGDIRFTGHAEARMAERDISKGDVTNVLRGGTPQPGEFENGTWRYQVRTAKFVVVVAFRGEDVAVVVTAMRL